VATVEQFYVDTSVAQTLYVPGPGSLKVSRWRRGVGGAIPLTRFGYAELTNAVAQAQHRGILDVDGTRAAFAALIHDLADGHLRLHDLLWRRALDRTAELSRAHTISLGTRTLDVLHVASALELGAKTFVTYDTRQAALAKAVGLKTLAP
jgi:predicted nucleic acid-binding protein